MGTRRKSSKILELSGAYTKNPSRRRSETALDTRPIGEVPDHLTPEAKQVWLELINEAPSGLLTMADRAILEIAANLLLELRQHGAEMKATRLNLLVRLLGMFGMTPLNRASLDIPVAPKPENNPFLRDD